MRATTTALTLISATLGAAAGPKPDSYEAILQAQYLLSDLIDSKQYDRLNEAVTDDFVHDSRPLGDRGSLSEGVEEFANDVREAIGDALTQHSDSNTLIHFNNDEGTSANMTSYVTFSQWDPAALYDISRTFRIYERTDNTYVLDSNGNWKMSYSLVTNMAPRPEGIYWNDGNDRCKQVRCATEPSQGNGANYDDVDWTKVNYDNVDWTKVNYDGVKYDGVKYQTEPQPAEAEGHHYETQPKGDGYATQSKDDGYETQYEGHGYETQPMGDHYETEPQAEQPKDNQSWEYKTEAIPEQHKDNSHSDEYETESIPEKYKDKNHSGEYQTESIPEQYKDNNQSGEYKTESIPEQHKQESSKHNSGTYETEHMH